MGLFKKIFKGIGKVFKKIGKGIKSAFKKFGKFMGKIGILGQIAMMFILPGVGNAFLAKIGSWATTLGAKSGVLAKGLGKVLAGAHRFGTAAKAGFNSITTAVTEFGKTALNKVGEATGLFKIDSAAANFFGPKGTDTAFSRTSAGFKNIGDVWRAGARDGTITAVKEVTVDEMAKNLGMSKENLLKINVGNTGISGNKIAQDTILNTDLFSFSANNGNVVTDLVTEIPEIVDTTAYPTGGPKSTVTTTTTTKGPVVEGVDTSKSLLEADGPGDVVPTDGPSPVDVDKKSVWEKAQGEASDYWEAIKEKPIRGSYTALNTVKSILADDPDLDRYYGSQAFTTDLDDSMFKYGGLSSTYQDFLGQDTQYNPAEQTSYGVIQAITAQLKGNQQFIAPPGAPGVMVRSGGGLGPMEFVNLYGQSGPRMEPSR